MLPALAKNTRGSSVLLRPISLDRETRRRLLRGLREDCDDTEAKGCGEFKVVEEAGPDTRRYFFLASLSTCSVNSDFPDPRDPIKSNELFSDSRRVRSSTSSNSPCCLESP